MQIHLTSEETARLRRACGRPADLFRRQVVAPNLPLPDRANDARASKSSGMRSKSSTGVSAQQPLKMAPTDKLAMSVISRVLPYVCNTCMRCNRQAETQLVWCGALAPLFRSCHGFPPGAVVALLSHRFFPDCALCVVCCLLIVCARSCAALMRRWPCRGDLELLVLAAFWRVLQRRHAWYRHTVMWLQACVRHRRFSRARAAWAGVTGDGGDLPEELRSLLW